MHSMAGAFVLCARNVLCAQGLSASQAGPASRHKKTGPCGPVLYYRPVPGLTEDVTCDVAEPAVRIQHLALQIGGRGILRRQAAGILHRFDLVFSLVQAVDRGDRYAVVLADNAVAGVDV